MKIKKEYYYEYLLSPQWKEKREKLFALRGKKCEKCKNTTRLTVHHLTYDNIFVEPMEDLQILCLTCHSKQHPNKKPMKLLKPKPEKTLAGLQRKQNKKANRKKHKKNRRGGLAIWEAERKRKMGY